MRIFLFVMSVFVMMNMAGARAQASIPAPASLAGSKVSPTAKEDVAKVMADRRKEMYAKMGLSVDQIQKMEANRSIHQAAILETVRLMRANKEAIGEELKKPVLAEGVIKALNDKFKKLQDDLADQRLETVLELRRILTLEQYNQLTAEVDKQMRESLKDR